MESSKVGVIDCIGAGFSAVYRKPVILLVPIIIDLLLCFTPRISPQPLIDNLADLAGTTESQIQATAGDAIPQLPTSSPLEESLTLEDLEALGTANLAGILGTQVQSYFAFPSSGRIDQTTISVESWQGLLLSLLLFILGSVVIGTIYLEMIAQHIKVGSPWPIREGHLVNMATRLLGYTALVAFIYLAIAGVCLALLTLTFQLLPLVLLLGVTTAFICLVYLFVGEAALFMEDLRPTQALKSSILFARSHTLPLVGLVLLTAILGVALQIALGKIAAYPLGLLPAILLNGCVMTALTFAVMNYYWNHTEGGLPRS